MDGKRTYKEPEINPAQAFYDVPTFGNVSLLYFTDCHGQLLPIYYREPSINLGVGMALGRPPHLVGKALLQAFGIDPCSSEAHAFTHLDFRSIMASPDKPAQSAHTSSARLVKYALGANLAVAIAKLGGWD